MCPSGCKKDRRECVAVRKDREYVAVWLLKMWAVRFATENEAGE